MHKLLKLVKDAKSHAISMQKYEISSMLRDVEKLVEVDTTGPIPLNFQTEQQFEDTMKYLQENDKELFDVFVKHINER